MMLGAACGGDEKPAENAPQPSAMPSDTAPPAATTTEAMAPPPSASTTADQTPPPPPAKPAKEKIVGKFVQDFSGEVRDAADAAAKKSAGKADKDGKKYNAAMDKAKAGVADNTIEVSGDEFKHLAKGKADHDMKYEVANSTDTALSIKWGKDAKGKDVKGMTGSTCDITFTDDNTFSMKDCFAKDPKKAQTLVYKRQ